MVPSGMPIPHTAPAPPTPTPVVYAVTATLPDQPTADRYLAWLTGGHIQTILASGADLARVVRPVDPPGPLRIRSEYTFPSLNAYETYVQEHAPVLRADGLARFGPDTGVRLDRELTEVVWSSAAP
jgi:hypothetical protein